VLNEAWGGEFWGQLYTAWRQLEAAGPPNLECAAAPLCNAALLDCRRFSSDALRSLFHLERQALVDAGVLLPPPAGGVLEPRRWGRTEPAILTNILAFHAAVDQVGPPRSLIAAATSLLASKGLHVCCGAPHTAFDQWALHHGAGRPTAVALDLYPEPLPHRDGETR
jgi:hypothetical protein